MTRASMRGRVHRTEVAAVAVFVLVLALLAVHAWVAEPFRIPSQSMEPTLRPGDQVLVDKRAYRDGSPRRGDLVAFTDPKTRDVLLKRVVALGGDTVGIEDGALVVDGRHVREPYAPPDKIDSVYFGPVRVPRGAVFVLGDNRANSVDSRQFGSVPAPRLIGRAVARLWPPGRWGAPD